MSYVNRVILVGNLGGDPDLRFTAKGIPVVNLSLATNRQVETANGDKRKDTFWHRAVLWGKRAETSAKYLRKGSRVYIEGLLQPKQWVDKEGTSHKSSEIIVDEIVFLGGGSRQIEGAIVSDAPQEFAFDASEEFSPDSPGEIAKSE